MTILVTGAAGFIGFHVCQALLARGECVLGVDNLNAYYDVALKEARLALLQAHEGFAFARADIADREAMAAAVAPARGSITGVVHLAAQAGVRHSLVDPYAYVQANVMGQVVMLELCRALPRAGAPRLRQLQLGLRRRNRGAVLDRCPRRFPGLPLCRD